MEKKSSLRSRSNRLEVVAENKRKAAADSIELKSDYTERRNLEWELRAGRRCARLMSKSSIIFDEIVDFSIFPSVLPFDLPSLSEDFDIPSRWKTAEKPHLNTFPRYRALTKNLYRFPLQRGSCSADDVPYCSCDPAKGCGLDCENRVLFMECAAGDCPSLPAKTDSGLEVFCKPCKSSKNNNIKGRSNNGRSSSSMMLFCSNTNIQRSSYPLSEVYRTGSCGFGLRISEDIKIGAVVVEYTGEVITAAECSERMMDMKESDDFYFASLGGGLMLDAKYMGSVARFANHSCEPTCKLQKWSVLGESCIALVAARALPAGSEITYNYHYYEDGLDNISAKMKRQKCLCGAVNCSGTIGGRVTASESDSWLKKATLLLSSNRKRSLDILNSHIQLGETVNISLECSELVEMKNMVKEINHWVVKKNEIFSNYSETCSLMDFSVAQQLSENYRWTLKANDFILLEQQMKKVLKIEKALRNLRGRSPSFTGTVLSAEIDTNDNMDDSHSHFHGSGSQNTDGSKYCSEIADRESISHSENDIKSGAYPNAGNSTSTRFSGDNGDKAETCGRPIALPSLKSPSLSSASASIRTQGPQLESMESQKNVLVKTVSFVHNEGTPKEVNDNTDGNDECGEQEECIDVSFSSNNVVSGGRMSVSTSSCNVSGSDMRTNHGCSRIVGNESSDMRKTNSTGNIDIASSNLSSITNLSDLKLDQNGKLSKILWNDLMSLFKDVVSVLPLRCSGVEVLLSLYHSVNDWTKRYIGGILHHCSFASLYSRVPSLADPILPVLLSVPLSLNFKGESMSASQKTQFSNLSDPFPLSSSLSRKISTGPSNRNAFLSKPAPPRNIIATKNVQQKVPGNNMMDVIDRVASQYSQHTPACEVLAAETFLEFRVGLFMERMAAVSSTNTVKEIDNSAVKAASSMPSSSASSLPALFLPANTDPTDILCFCRMSAAMGETPVLSQCDSCDKWYHPNCVNAALVSQSASRSCNSFLCPLCCHMQGKPSNFAYKPVSEWKIIRNAGSGSLNKKCKNVEVQKNKQVIAVAADIVTTVAPVAATPAPGSSNEDKRKTEATVDAATSIELTGKRSNGGQVQVENKRVRATMTSDSKDAIRINAELDPDSVQKICPNSPAACVSLERGAKGANCSVHTGAIQFSDNRHEFSPAHNSVETTFPRRNGQYDPQKASDNLHTNSMEKNLNIIYLSSDYISEKVVSSSSTKTSGKVKCERQISEGIQDLPDGRIAQYDPHGLLTSSLNHDDSLLLRREINPADALPTIRLSSASSVAGTIPLSSTGRKTKKMTSPRTASDPLSIDDLRVAIEAEKKLMVSQSPAALLLGLCSIYIETWRERAVAFLSRCDVLFIVLRNHDSSNQTQENIQFLNQEDSLLTKDATESPADILNSDTSVEGGFDRAAKMKRRESETMLLKECLQLYFEPRLLRIQPPESLELRAVAYLISASTVLTASDSNVPIKRHSLSKNEENSPNPALTINLLDGIRKNILGVQQNQYVPDRNKVPDANDISYNYLARPTLHELEMIIDGGKHFSRLQLNGKLESRGSKGQTPTSITSRAWVSKPADGPEVNSKEACCDNMRDSVRTFVTASHHRENGVENASSREEEGDRESMRRRLVLWTSIQIVTNILSTRLDRCQRALDRSSRCTLRCTHPSLDSNRAVINALDSDFHLSNIDGSGLGVIFNPVASLTGNNVAFKVNNEIYADVHVKKNSLEPGDMKSSLNELLRVDALLEEAGRGLSIQGEYSYVRLKSLIFAGIKEFGSVTKGEGLEEKEGKGEVRKDSIEISHDVSLPSVVAAGLYCWCRGIDDGFPMVQCDGCDEWFHSRCMGIAKESQAKQKKRAGDKHLKGKCARDSSYLPTMSIHVTEGEEHSDGMCALSSERSSMESDAKRKATAATIPKSKSKSRSKGVKLMKHLEETIQDMFYCISCAEERGTSYAFEWRPDYTTANSPIPSLIPSTVD